MGKNIKAFKTQTTKQQDSGVWGMKTIYSTYCQKKFPG